MPKRKEEQPDKKGIALKGLEYDALKKSEKEIKTKIADCRVPLEEAVKTFGLKLPTGSIKMDIPYAGVTVSLNQTLRVSSVLLPEAIEIMQKDPLLKQCVEDVPTIRLDRLEALVEKSKVPDDVLKKLFAPVESYAFSVKIKKGVPDEME